MPSIPLRQAGGFTPVLLATLLCFPLVVSAEFSCPAGTTASCLASGEKICGQGTKCVDQSATCFENFPCGAGEAIVCGPEYDAALDAHRATAQQYDQLAAENVELREQRLNRKNCVLNATRLADAKNCMR